MRFGHYTVFDTPEENKHTQVYVEYDVPNKDNLDGATGTMILSDGSGDSSGGGGGDSRFSTCEVEIFFTSNGQPLTLEQAVAGLFNEYSATPVVDPGGSQDNYYHTYAIMVQDDNIVKPLLFEGTAYLSYVEGGSDETMYWINSEVTPVCTGDISFSTFGGNPCVKIEGDGTITFEMVEV